ncbi:MAG: peptidylprolyl isomerase [Pseudomonadota bacterium]
MKKTLLPLAAFALTLPALAQESEPPPPSPSDIVNAAPQEAWKVITPEDLLVMTLAPSADGAERKVIIQLMPEPFSQGWVANIRTLARARWYDGISVNRVQDNYVVQWGDPNYDNPESGGEAKRLPEGLKVMGEDEYSVGDIGGKDWRPFFELEELGYDLSRWERSDLYAPAVGFVAGWPLGHAIFASNMPVFDSNGDALPNIPAKRWWPVHCYSMVGVGRNYSPDTGSGAELYTVIGHAPRHLDRNIALVGRIIEGMEHLSSLPRGKGALGFYAKEEADKRTPILSIRVASDLPEDDRPQFEYLSTESESFARYAEARANRRDPFFITPAGGADICNIPVPIRRFEYTGEGDE